MYPTGVRWPTRYDYDTAMEELVENMQNLELRRGHLFKSIKTGFLVQYGNPDAHTCLYRIDNWMIRCFCRVDDKEPNEQIISHYQKLSTFFREHLKHVSALVPLDYIEKGIKVAFFERDQFHEPISFLKEGIMPIVKMPYVEGASLGSFISGNYDNAQVMNQLSDSWLRMVGEMEDVHMAHGDLDLTNVRVQEGPSRGELTLKLIDYDNTWIPIFEQDHCTLPEFGHEHFQHPYFYDSEFAQFNEKIDRFAALVIYISLQLLVAYPELFRTWQMSENCLVFAPGDYKAEQKGRSERISELRSLNIPGLESYIVELSSSLRNNSVPRSLITIAGQVSRVGSSTRSASETSTAQPMYNPQQYREVVIPDWDSVEYINKQQKQPPDSSPRPLPDREEQGIGAQASIDQQQPGLVRLPGNRQEPSQPKYPLEEEPIRLEGRLSLPLERASFAPPQEPVRLSSEDDEVYSPYTKTQRVADRTKYSTSYVEKGGQAQNVQNRQTLLDPATWIGCGIILIALLVIILVILLVVNLSHSHSGSMLSPVYQAMTHVISIQAPFALPTTFMGDNYAI